MVVDGRWGAIGMYDSIEKAKGAYPAGTHCCFLRISFTVQNRKQRQVVRATNPTVINARIHLLIE